MELPINYDDAHWTVRQKARKQYILEQDGLCQYCKEPLTGAPMASVRDAFINPGLFPKNMFKYPVHLHHNRRTGLTIGAVHSRCNAYMWQFKGE